MVKKSTIAITVLILAIAASIGIHRKKGVRAIIHPSPELTLTEGEKLSLEQVERQFSSELLRTLDFAPLFNGDLFANNFFDYPDGWKLVGPALDAVPNLDQELLKRYAIARWNFLLYVLIHINSQTDWSAKKFGPEHPQFIETYFKENPKVRSLIQGYSVIDDTGRTVKAPITDRTELLQVTAALGELNPQFKNEIERNALLQRPAFLHWIGMLDSDPGRIRRKAILKEPKFGLPSETTVYTITSLVFGLDLIKTKDGFKIVAIMPDSW